MIDAARRGWIYQTGGSGAYLALRARAPELRRIDVDDAVAQDELLILTGVRGCTFLVPRAEGPIARVAWKARVEDAVEKLGPFGLDVPQLRTLCDEIEDIASEPVDPAAIRKRARSIQEVDAPRFGLKNTLPLAIRVLEAEGRLTRLPARGRLDDERYRWRVSTPTTIDADDAARELVRSFVAATAPTATAHMAAWLDVGAKAAAQRLADCGARETADGWRVDDVNGGTDDRVHFLPLRDPLIDLRTPSLVPEGSEDTVVDGWGTKPTTIGRQPTVHHHTIVWRNAIVGLWEWADDRLVAGFFGPPPPHWKDEAAAVERWIRDELGDVFVYAQDGAAQRRRRTVVVRELASRR